MLNNIPSTVYYVPIIEVYHENRMLPLPYGTQEDVRRLELTTDLHKLELNFVKEISPDWRDSNPKALHYQTGAFTTTPLREACTANPLIARPASWCGH